MTSTTPDRRGTSPVTAPAARPSARRLAWPLAFAAWTLFVWGGRLRNLIQEPGPLADVSRWSLVASIVFSVLGLAVTAVAALAARSRAVAALLTAAVAALGSLTVAVWVPRAIDIALGDHDPGFVVVHVVLAVVSIVLAGLALVTVRRRTGAGSGQLVGYHRSDG
ncbi:MAG: hypothetical protein AAGA93_17630 [Actinomycetota bacterium]